ncbi:MAG: hypothetical protein NUW37_08850, partial [Planctomycetes bacterium]|nr:hypothetical protein [Planctomycetota bacterium]
NIPGTFLAIQETIQCKKVTSKEMVSAGDVVHRTRATLALSPRLRTHNIFTKISDRREPRLLCLNYANVEDE